MVIASQPAALKRAGGLARYKRARNRAEELHHGLPTALDLAIPELRDKGVGTGWARPPGPC